MPNEHTYRVASWIQASERVWVLFMHLDECVCINDRICGNVGIGVEGTS